MKSVLLAGLLFMSAAWAEVLLQPNFNAEKFSGLWFVVSMASDCKVFLGSKDQMRMSKMVITATAAGNLHFHMEFPGAERCDQMDAEYLRVGSQGHFRAPALDFLDVRVVDTDYSSFAVVYTYKKLAGDLSTVLHLYSRTPETSTQAMKTFQDVYSILGLSSDMMVMLPKSDACPPGGQGTR